METVGDMARALVLRSNQARLRAEMDSLAVEVSTGFVRDSAGHLKGDTSALLDIDRALEQLEVYRVNTASARFLTGTMQATLAEMQDRSEGLSQVLLSAELTPNDALRQTLAEDGANALNQIVSAMNRAVAGRFLFSGTATDTAPMPEADALLGDVRTALTGAGDLAAVDAALDLFFGPGGGYETGTYQGSDTGLAPQQLSETETATVDIRATDPAFRALLQPILKAALATDPSLGFAPALQVEMLSSAGRDLLGAQTEVVQMRAGLGALEARLEETTVRIAAERSATSTARLDLVGTDQYETAARYESIRTQLESLYAITARSQRLSLAEFL